MKAKIKILGAALASMALVANASAQFDGTSGTNAVTALANNVQNAGNVFQPIVIGVIMIMTVIGVFYRFTRKAKIGT